jgi:hypothetical protein
MTTHTGSGGVTDTVRERAGETVHEARTRGREAAESQVDQRSTQAGETLHGVADQARDVSGTLRDQGNDTVARIVDQAAGYTERAADYLRNTSASTILDDVEGVARRQPWAVAGGALLVGFAAARVLTASRDRGRNGSSGLRDHSRDLESTYGYSTGEVPGQRESTLLPPASTTPLSPAVTTPDIAPATTPTPTPGTTSEGYGRGY